MNALIIDQFTRLAEQIEADYLDAILNKNDKESIRQKYRLKATKKNINILKKIKFKIKKSTDLKNIPDITQKTIDRVNEIINTGKLSEIRNDLKKNKNLNSIQELENVIGIGKKIAKDLVLHHNIHNVEELKDAVSTNKIILNDKILLGLKYYGVVKGDIPRKEIKLIKSYLKKEAAKLDPLLKIKICGSYRRGREKSGDIDVLLYHPLIKSFYDKNLSTKYNIKTYLKLFVESLEHDNFILDHITDKKYKIKYMGFCKYKKNPVRRIDIRFIPLSSLPTAVLYFTGPHELNTVMRTVAKKKNMILNEYGLYKIDDSGEKNQIKTKSEEDVFKILGMKYLTPKERETFSITKKLK